MTSAPFGTGPAMQRLETLGRRMQPADCGLLIEDGYGLKVCATFDDYDAPERQPFVVIEYGFVLASGDPDDKHNTEDGHLDHYERVSLTYEQLDRLIEAYTARKLAREGK